MEIVQVVKKLNSISRERLNFRRRPILVQLCMETLYKRATSVAHLANFSFEFFYAILTQDAPLLFIYHGAKKSKMTKNSNQGFYLNNVKVRLTCPKADVRLLEWIAETKNFFMTNSGLATNWRLQYSGGAEHCQPFCARPRWPGNDSFVKHIFGVEGRHRLLVFSRLALQGSFVFAEHTSICPPGKERRKKN